MIPYQMAELIENGPWTVQREKKIARITTMFHGGQVRLEVAKDAILKLSFNEDVTEIETTRLSVKPLAQVTFDQEIRKDIEREEAERVKAQGLAPRERPTI